jgi:hypothetical protein
MTATTGSITVAAAGSGFVPNSVAIVCDDYGDCLRATVGSSGTITGIASIIARGWQTSPPNNPVAFNARSDGANDGLGSGLTLNLSWTAETTLGIGTSAATAINIGNSASTTTLTGILKGAAGAFTADGTTATTMTSLGPTGAHTTVQEWFTVTDASGTVRYIPAY